MLVGETGDDDAYLDIPFGENPVAANDDKEDYSTDDDADDLEEVRTTYGTYFHSANGVTYVAHAEKYKA